MPLPRPGQRDRAGRRGHPDRERHLELGSTIEGTVVATGATSSAGICVFAYDAGGDQIGGVLTDANGTYQLTRPAGPDLHAWSSTRPATAASRATSGSETYRLARSARPARPSPTSTGRWPWRRAWWPPRHLDVAAGGLGLVCPTPPPCRPPAAPGRTPGRRSGCPPRLSLDATTGVISGTPTAPFELTVTVTATDSSQQPLASAAQQLELSITGGHDHHDHDDHHDDLDVHTTSRTSVHDDTLPPTTSSTTRPLPPRLRLRPPAAGWPGGGGWRWRWRRRWWSRC